MKKLGLLCLAVVLALGSLGVGFAYWTETLEIGQNQVDTGTVTYGFYDRYGQGGPHRCDEYPPEDTIDVGSCTCVFTDPVTDPITGSGGYYTMECTLNNTYPSYKVNVDFYTMNLGTLPLKVTGITVSDPNEVLLYHSGDGGYDGFLFKDNDSSGTYTLGDDRVIDYDFANLKNAKFAPGGYNLSGLYLHVASEAAENATYTVRVQIQAVQAIGG